MSSEHSSASNNNDQILTELKLYSRTIILNRPRQLNALSHLMVCRLQELYSKWENDDNVKLVIIKGKGRAFCAGGDVAIVCRLSDAGKYKESARFFWDEYIMNYTLGTYKKPQVALLNGIVMGGGAGVSIHGRFRVVTEKTLFSMPETELGLHPDVGASYFLSRLPGFFGEYLGLTGMRLDGAEMLSCGLATHFVHSTKLPFLEEALAKIETSDPNVVNSVIDGFSDMVTIKDGSVLHRLDIVGRSFSKETVEEVLSNLELEAKFADYQWIKSSILSLKKASPISLKITLRSIREGRRQQLHECLVREYRMTLRIILHKVSRDLYEGCRAILVDKDRNPKWKPEKLEQVTQDMVDHYFSRLDDGLEDLQLPVKQREQNAQYHVHAKL